MHFNLNRLTKKNTTIGTLGSHSALDICRGAKDAGLKTLVVAQTGRALTYNKYFKSNGDLGCIDTCLIINQFKDLLSPIIQSRLNTHNVIFVPHRSFQVYLDFDYQSIETKFQVPMFGNRHLLKIEERNTHFSQYQLMQQANIPYPKIITNPDKIDRLCLVKVTDQKSGFERAFFLAASSKEFTTKSKSLIEQKIISSKLLSQATIEEFIVGTHVNFNFFYSPLSRRLELLGTDTRRQTNKDGVVTTPAPYQPEIIARQGLSYQESGHIAVTVLESMLEQAFDLGERFVKTAKKLYPPGIIGPFALQTIITPGPPKKIFVVDISPRMPGSPGISSTPYTNYLHGQSMSVGQRLALEIKLALDQKHLNLITT